MRVRVSVLFVTIACTVLPAAAHAGDVVKARELFSEGVRLYQQSDWEGAKKRFREAEAEHHAAAIVYNIGLAEEKTGRPQAAIDAYEAYIAEVGERGDLTASATTAIVQIKARTTRLKIDSKPAGARLFVDGSPLSEPAPTSLLVFGGHHVIVAQGDGWRGERDIDARGAADVMTVLVEPATLAHEAVPIAPATTNGEPPPPPPRDKASVERPPFSPVQPGDQGPEGLVWGASFVMAPAFLLGVTNEAANNRQSALSIVAGPLVDVGLALTDRFEFVGRFFAGVGPDAKPSYAFGGGPGLSFKALSSLWVGATFIGGQLETKARGVRYGTDLVFGTMLEVGLVVLKKSSGEWIATFQPAFLLTEMRQDNTTFFFPFGFGYRAF